MIQVLDKSYNGLVKLGQHELTLPVFYREPLARILSLERFRNLIETNIEAGITLYTDHKPALFENSLSNKGQLSAWKLAEVADLLSIVENLYRQEGKMMFADPLSRVCGPTEGWYDPSLPRKLAALFEHLPTEVRNNVSVRVYAGKDTYAAGRLVQKWRRKPTNPVSQGKLLTKDLAPSTFYAPHLTLQGPYPWWHIPPNGMPTRVTLPMQPMSSTAIRPTFELGPPTIAPLITRTTPRRVFSQYTSGLWTSITHHAYTMANSTLNVALLASIGPDNKVLLQAVYNAIPM